MRLTKVFLTAFVVLLTHALVGQALLDPLSGTSLRLTIRHDNIEIGVGTGFVVQKGSHYYLITNRHIVLACSENKDPNDVGSWLCADNLLILHDKLNRPGEWILVEEKLYDEHKVKLWREHPNIGTAPGSSIDVVALPLTHTAGVGFLPLDLETRKADLRIGPGDTVTIVGFPFGLAQAAGLAIWKTGTIASDTIVNYDGKAKFLIDTTSRPGMSGSPVYARRVGSYQSTSGQMMFGSGSITKFLGVFAEESQAAEIGVVWKADVVQSLYDSLP
jgi:hypothetical protein